MNINRLQVAADVIGYICSGALVPMYGKIFDENITDAANSPEASAKEFLEKQIQNVSCEVCAKGAIFVGHILRFNKMTNSEMIKLHRPLRSPAVGDFSAKMLAEIETLYEAQVADWNIANDRGELSGDEFQLLLEYRENHFGDLSQEKRLLHILGLLIQNGGDKIVLPN